MQNKNDWVKILNFAHVALMAYLTCYKKWMCNKIIFFVDTKKEKNI